MMNRADGTERMKAFTWQQPLAKLAEALLMLDAKAKLTEPERLTRTVIIDVICEKSPEANAAFDAWAESDDNPATAVEAIIAAIP